MIYFTTENYLKKKTPITANCDANDVSQWVQPAAEVRIKPILGDLFFKDLLTKYNAQTLNSYEVDLVEYIKPCVAWRAAALTVYGLSRQLKNKGLQIQDGENSDGVDLKEVTFGMDHYNQIASEYQRTLIDFLIDNKDNYPVFLSDANKNSSAKNAICSGQVDDGFTDSILIV
jgi:hypothetical protein